MNRTATKLKKGGSRGIETSVVYRRERKCIRDRGLVTMSASRRTRKEKV